MLIPKFNLQYIREKSLSNIGYKLASVMLATFVWYLVLGEQVLEVNLKVNVKINVDEDYLVEGGPTRTRDVTLRGPRVFLADIPDSPLEANIDIGKGKMGAFRYRIEKNMIKDLDQRLEVQVHDEYLNLFVDRKMTRVLPVKEFFMGTPADGFMIKRTAIEPKYVKVTGLKSIVRRLKKVQTDSIDVSGIQANQTYEVPILIPERVEKSGLSVDMVTVKLEVAENKINKTFSKVPIEVIGSEFLTTTRPRYASVVIQGTPAVLSFITKDDLNASVEVRDEKPGKVEKDIQIKIPSDTVLIETTPKSAIVEIYNVKKMK